MRYSVIGAALAALALSGCLNSGGGDVSRSFDGVNVIDENNLSDIMLTVADPNEAVAYFRRSSTEEPKRLDLKRGLAMSLVRAGKPAEAVPVWRKVTSHKDATN